MHAHVEGMGRMVAPRALVAKPRFEPIGVSAVRLTRQLHAVVRDVPPACGRLRAFVAIVAKQWVRVVEMDEDPARSRETLEPSETAVWPPSGACAMSSARCVPTTAERISSLRPERAVEEDAARAGERCVDPLVDPCGARTVGYDAGCHGSRREARRRLPPNGRTVAWA
jgi:hypothetical protein